MIMRKIAIVLMDTLVLIALAMQIETRLLPFAIDNTNGIHNNHGLRVRAMRRLNVRLEI